jgi:hypothetical protein
MPGSLELLHHQGAAGGAERLGTMSKDHNVMPPKAEMPVPIGALHFDRALAQEPALEFPAGHHVAPPSTISLAHGRDGRDAVQRLSGWPGSTPSP